MIPFLMAAFPLFVGRIRLRRVLLLPARPHRCLSQSFYASYPSSFRLETKAPCLHFLTVLPVPRADSRGSSGKLPRQSCRKKGRGKGVRAYLCARTSNILPLGKDVRGQTRRFRLRGESLPKSPAVALILREILLPLLITWDYGRALNVSCATAVIFGIWLAAGAVGGHGLYADAAFV